MDGRAFMNLVYGMATTIIFVCCAILFLNYHRTTNESNKVSGAIVSNPLIEKPAERKQEKPEKESKESVEDKSALETLARDDFFPVISLVRPGELEFIGIVMIGTNDCGGIRDEFILCPDKFREKEEFIRLVRIEGREDKRHILHFSSGRVLVFDQNQKKIHD